MTYYTRNIRYKICKLYLWNCRKNNRIPFFTFFTFFDAILKSKYNT